jgi:twitching motility protein PilT
MEQGTHKQFLERLLETVYVQEASDLHLSGKRVPFLRIKGELYPLQNLKPLSNDDMIELIKILVSPDRFEIFQKKQEIDFAYEYQSKIRFRGNAFIKMGQISLALRSIKKVHTLEELHLPEALKEFTKQKQGFFLVVGPVGQGKSTTLAAMINEINERRKEHIITIENPIEYIHEEKSSIIDQREVGIDTDSFHSALLSVFRQDVNVILIGEMRSPETIATAVTAAETGHLVYSTLHTNNAAQTIDRIIDSFPAEQQGQIRIQLASSLLGIFSQRLIPSTNGDRLPAYELLINNRAVSTLIREGRTHEIDTVLETSYEQGMITMNRSLLELVRAGHISVEDARAYSLNPKGFDSMLIS